MTDGVQKGSGNAYSLRTVPNALSLYPTYEDFIRAFASGQIFTDLKINTPGWNTTGTALNKANLLSDAVETAIWGSTANRTPNQALEKLRADPYLLSADDCGVPFSVADEIAMSMGFEA